jgi:hypothetical protein
VSATQAPSRRPCSAFSSGEEQGRAVRLRKSVRS